MKTYLPQIERRIFVRPNQSYGILNFDLDNAYPQRMLEMVGQSPTAKDCWDKRAKFIGGNGFEEDKLDAVAINGKGLTLGKLLKMVATDKGLFRAFGIHVNYDANYKKVSAHYIRFEDIRLGDIDNKDRRGKFVLYNDWGRRTWKNITLSKFNILEPYNPDPAVIKQQVIEAGGWDRYNGQLYYFNPEVDDYPLICADSVTEDFETEAGIKIFANRQITTGFLPSAIFTQMSRREEADNEPVEDDGMLNQNQPTQFERDLGSFQGVKNGQKILVVEYDDPAARPELLKYDVQNNDKLFQVTEQSVEARIIKAFSVPKELVSSQAKNGLSNGGEKKEAIREFNDNTAPERIEVSAAFADIFSEWATPINPSDNWTIRNISDDVADMTFGVKAGPAINQLLLLGIPKANKIEVLVNVYGMNRSQAELMVPDDDKIKQTKPLKPLTDDPDIPDK